MLPSMLLFTTTLVISTLITLSSTNWLYLWTGMELNLISFIPLMASSTKFLETEASVKYFIVQAVGSGLMLTSGIISMNPISFNLMLMITNMLFITSMVMKLGLTPCHQWLPHVMSSMPWLMCLILATWQKISPLVLLVFMTPQYMAPIIMLICMLSAIIGGMGGMNQSQLRSLLAYSSIGHMAWMLSTMNCNIKIFLAYFLTYITISTTLMSIFMMFNIILSKLSNSMLNLNTPSFIMIMLIMFSLGGLPPFLGFIPKWLIITSFMSSHMIIVLMALIIGSLINLFYYFNMSFNFFLSARRAPTSTMPPTMLIIMTILCTLSSMMISI